MKTRPLNTVEAILQHPGYSRPQGDLRAALVDLTRKDMNIPDSADNFDRMVLVKKYLKDHPIIPRAIVCDAARVNTGYYYRTMIAPKTHFKSSSELQLEVAMSLLELRQQYGGRLGTTFYIRELEKRGIHAGVKLVNKVKKELAINDND